MDLWFGQYKEKKMKKDGVGEIGEKNEHNYDFPLTSFQLQGKMFTVLGYLTEEKIVSAWEIASFIQNNDRIVTRNILNSFSVGCNDKMIGNFRLKESFLDKLIYQRSALWSLVI